MLHGIVFFLYFKKNPLERVLNGLQSRGMGREREGSFLSVRFKNILARLKCDVVLQSTTAE